LQTALLHSNIILAHTTRFFSSVVSSLQILRPKFCMHFSSSRACYIRRSSHSPRVYHPNNFWIWAPIYYRDTFHIFETYKSLHCHSMAYRPKYYLSTSGQDVNNNDCLRNLIKIWMSISIAFRSCNFSSTSGHLPTHGHEGYEKCWYRAVKIFRNT